MYFYRKKLIPILKGTIRKCSYDKKPPWNVLFFGTDDFSIYSLKTLYHEFKQGSLIRKLEVSTNVKTNANPVLKFADKYDLKVHKWPLVVPKNEFDVGLVVSFGHLIPQEVIQGFPFGIVNVHASLLPRWRGAAPIIYAIAKGDFQTGITIMRIKPEKFDVGDVISQRTVALSDNITMPELHGILGELGAEELVRVLGRLPEALDQARPQAPEGVTFAPKVTNSFAQVSWSSMNSTQIYNLQRAVTGLLSLTTTWFSTPIKLINVQRCFEELKVNDCSPGFVVYDKTSKTLKVLCCNQTWVSVEQVGMLGKKVMKASDFNNGYLKKVDVSQRYFR